MSCAETQNEEKTTNPKGIIVLGVYIHCEGCANEVLKYLRGFEGVEGVEIDAKNNKVSVKGEKADPIKVRERLMKKSGKHVELISPKPQKQDQKKKEEKKPEVKVFEVLLRVYIHCEGCAKEVKHCILKMEGVQTVDLDAAKNTVSVKGSMDPKKLVEFIDKRGGRHAEILKQTKMNKNEEQKHVQNSKQTKTKKNEQQKNDHDTHQTIFAPQLFSDENPNSCSLM